MKTSALPPSSSWPKDKQTVVFVINSCMYVCIYVCIQINARREKSDAQTQLQIERERLEGKARDVLVLRQELKEGIRPLGLRYKSICYIPFDINI